MTARDPKFLDYDHEADRADYLADQASNDRRNTGDDA